MKLKHRLPLLGELALLAFIAAFAMPVLNATASSGTQCYRITGTWSISAPLLNEEVSDQRFEVYICGKKYFMAVESKRARAPHLVHATSDGTDFYVANHPIEWIESDLITPVAKGNVQSFGAIHPKTFPADQHAALQILWWAFFFDQLSENDSEKAWPIPFSMMVKEETVRLKKFILKTNSGNDIRKATQISVFLPGSGTDKEGMGYRLVPEAYGKNGRLMFRLSKPKTAEMSYKPGNSVVLQMYTPKRDGVPAGAEDVTLLTEWKFTVNSVGPVSDLPSPYPIIPAGASTLVADYRLVTSTGERIGGELTSEEGFYDRTSPRFIQAAAAIASAAPRFDGAKLTFIGVFFGLILTILVLLGIRRQRASH